MNGLNDFCSRLLSRPVVRGTPDDQSAHRLTLALQVHQAGLAEGADAKRTADRIVVERIRLARLYHQTPHQLARRMELRP